MIPSLAQMRAYVGDTLTNLVSRMGSDKDKASATRFAGMELSRQELQLAYQYNGLARKIVDVPAWDMTRAGRNWKASEDDITALEAEERRLGLWPKLQQALIWDRGLGGGALIIGDGAEDPEQPLDPDTIAKDGIEYIQAVTRHQLTADEMETDPASPFYRTPRFWNLQSENGPVKLHASRVIAFISHPRLDPDLGLGDGWGDAVLQSIQTEVKNAGTAVQSLASLVFEAKVDVIRIPDLMANIGNEEYQTRLLTRLEMANTAKSIQNAMLLDKDEEWERKDIDFGTLPEVVNTLLMVVSGVADIPMTRLFGVQAKGLSNDGTGDLKNYYDGISGRQGMFLRPALDRLTPMLQRSALGKVDDGITWAFSPLWQEAPKTQAETNKLNAETAKIYNDTGLFPADGMAEAVSARIEDDGVFPGFQKAMDEAEEEADWEKDPMDLLPPGGMPLPGQPRLPAPAGARPAAANSNRPGQPQARAAASRGTRDAPLRTLYVHRKLLNGDAFLAWAREQGFKTTLTPDDLHVTVAYSKEPMDWADVPPDLEPLTVPNEGYRYLERFGKEEDVRKATVLVFCSDRLTKRWQKFINAGASWDHHGYHPHLTISYQADYLGDLWALAPYFGDLEFGPEVYQAIKPGAGDNVPEVSTEEG